jgi:metallopeptidase family M12-like protein
MASPSQLRENAVKLHTIAKLRTRTAARVGIVLLAVSVSTFAAPGVVAQSGASDKNSAVATEKGPPPVAHKVIISNLPRRKSRLYALLSRLLGKAEGEKLGLTQSEVWSVPQSRLARLVQGLKQFGCKVTHLREDSNHILKRRQGPVVMSLIQTSILRRVRTSRETVGVAMMKAPEPAVAEYALTGGANKPVPAGNSPPEDSVSRIVLPINDTQHVTIQRLKVVTTDKGSTWRGSIEETGESAVLMWWKDGHLSGVFGYKGHIYTIVNMGGEVHAVVETDPKMMPPDHAPERSDNARPPGDRAAAPQPQATAKPAPPPSIKPFSDAERLALEAKKVTIDVMLLYTKKAADRYINNPADLMELAVEQANETFRNSGLGNISLRLVHSQLIDYDETGGEQFSHLYRMVDGQGPFKDIRKLRNEKRADIVGVDPGGSVGLWSVDARWADSEEAYFVVHHSCAAITISIAHEIGHILGARHDRVIDANDAPFPYGHGHVNGAKWRDIMSYQQACDGCPRIPFWSNPRVMYRGEPTGTDAEDNARVILEQAERVSKFR